MSYTTQVLAWWGAALATVVFCWDVYKWRTTGARIRLTVRPNMRAAGDPELEGRDLISIGATNYGDRPTTLTHLAFRWYATWWKRIRQQSDKTFLVPLPYPGHLPYKLEVGEEWNGLTSQSEEVTGLATTGHLICELHHVCSKRPVKGRVVLRNSPPKRQ